MSFRRLALAAALVVAAPSAFAATANQNMAVSIDVTNACTLSTPALSFGTSDLAAAKNGSAIISVACSNKGAYSLAFNDGANASGSQRRLEQDGAGTDTLNYNLSGVSAGGAALTGFSGTSTGGNVANTHTVYGQVPAGQSNKATGSYSDSVQVTLTY